MKFLKISIITLLMCCSVTSWAKPGWNVWVQHLKTESVAQGVNPALFDRIFSAIPGPDPKVLRFDHTQPEHRLSFYKYRDTRGGSYKIMLGRKEFQKHQKLLRKIAREFGVDPCVIVSLWGMETSYGRFMGNFPVIKSLATLAYDSRRAQHFREELLLALQIVNQNQVPLEKFKGEWAGASGQPQFMPSSWFKYAVDYDKDGFKNIWTSYPDIFASMANYLVKNGWVKGEPWAIVVKLPSQFDMQLATKTITKSVSEWNALGVRQLNGAALPYPELQASIVHPNGGPTFLAFNNYKVLLSYNDSIYYVGTIGYMADEICRR